MNWKELLQWLLFLTALPTWIIACILMINNHWIAGEMTYFFSFAIFFLWIWYNLRLPERVTWKRMNSTFTHRHGRATSRHPNENEK